LEIESSFHVVLFIIGSVSEYQQYQEATIDDEEEGEAEYDQ